MDAHAKMISRCRDMIRQLNLYLNHFPKHEKYGLCQHMRNAAYDIYALIVECNKRYHKKTALVSLDIRHEQLRMFVHLAFEMGLEKVQAQDYLQSIREWLRENLRLDLSRWTAQPARKGMNFVGYRMWPGLRLIRKRSLRNFHHAGRRGNIRSVVSLLGHARKTHTLTYMLRTLRYRVPAVLNRLPETYKHLALEA